MLLREGPDLHVKQFSGSWERRRGWFRGCSCFWGAALRLKVEGVTTGGVGWGTSGDQLLCQGEAQRTWGANSIFLLASTHELSDAKPMAQSWPGVGSFTKVIN